MRDIEGVIERIGGQGDGVLNAPSGRYYVPFTVPGDRVAARIGEARGDGFAASLHELLAPGASRVAAPCPLFHDCGGCRLQHWADPDYLAWKRDMVVQALARRGLDTVPVAETVTVPPGERRRGDLVARRLAKGVALGLHETGGKRIVDMTECAVLAPPLVALLPKLRRLLLDLLSPAAVADVIVTLTAGGIDLALGLPAPPPQADRMRLAAFAEENDLARIALLPDDVLVVRRAPVLRYGTAAVEQPPGGFVQASPAAEAAMTALLLRDLKPVKRIIDLFSGAGTFTFPLAHLAPVHAADSDAALINALQVAANRAVLGGRVSSEVRDLFRRPFSAAELKRYDIALFDPPRAGAREQAAELAKSAVPVVLAVSCNPSSFSRDARLLADGGYRLAAVTPVDQFRWSPHVELVARFERD
jgi:23S rRNA (uracil1939-C5)-methyltransferase